MKRSDIIFVLVMLAVIGAIFFLVTREEGGRYSRRELEEQRITNLLVKNDYGIQMNFHYYLHRHTASLPTDGWVTVRAILPSSHTHDPFYTDIVFVHNEEEALDFPSNIIVAWPNRDIVVESTGLNYSEALILGIHWAVNRTEESLLRTSGSREGQLLRPVIILEEFGLTYPISIEDLVDNWEKVNTLWFALDPNERSLIRQGAFVGGPGLRGWTH